MEYPVKAQEKVSTKPTPRLMKLTSTNTKAMNLSLVSEPTQAFSE